MGIKGTRDKKAETLEQILKKWPKLKVPKMEFKFVHQWLRWLGKATYIIEFATAHERKWRNQEDEFTRLFFKASKLRGRYRKQQKEKSILF